MPEHQSGRHLMMRTAVNLWVGFLVMCATAFMGAMLLVSGPAAAAPVTGVTGTTGTYGPVTSGSTVTPATTAPTTPAAPVTSPTIAFTGADLALMFTFGAVAIGVGGTLVLVSRRRRSENLA
jgi:hypothetical protein